MRGNLQANLPAKGEERHQGALRAGVDGIQKASTFNHAGSLGTLHQSGPAGPSKRRLLW